MTSYTRTAQAAHWLVAALLIGSFSLGFTMTEMAVSPTRLKAFAWHKWIGVTIFTLVLLRLAWRALHPPPPLPAGLPAWEVRAAAISHHLLYLFLICVPLSGWLMSSAKGFQTVWLGVLPIPDLLGKNPPLGEALEAVHETLTRIFLGVIGIHVLAALKHHFVDRNEMLARMLPGVRPLRREP